MKRIGVIITGLVIVAAVICYALIITMQAGYAGDAITSKHNATASAIMSK